MITTIIIAVLALLVFFGSSLLQKLLSPAPTVNQASITYKKEDINKDEKIDQSDMDIVIKQLSCQKADSCWNKVIDKTLNGDNPIYVFDLDMNGDGLISQIDVDQVQSVK
jgi:hypothetical protein